MATLAQAIDAINNLTNAVNTKIQDIDSRLTEKENEVTQFLLNAPDSYMNKTFYVDAINGSDTNDGSSGAPFATLSKAADSIPVGGVGHIHLLGDYTLDSVVDLQHKDVFIYSDYALHFDLSTVGSYEGYINKILVRNTNLYLAVDLITLGRNKTSVNLNGTYDTAICGYAGACGSAASGFNNLIIDTKCKDGNFIEAYKGTLFGPQAAWGGGEVGVFGLHLKRYNNLNTSYVLLDGGVLLSGNVMQYSVHDTNAIKAVDSAGNILSLDNCVSGVLKDANGVPRNITSNIVF